MTRDLICIGCPLGCMMKVSVDGDNVTVTGNTCIRGEQYGKKEVLSPRRIVTSTVEVDDGKIPRVSVRQKQIYPRTRYSSAWKKYTG